mgnify:CR=1 FL=1
MSNTIAYLRASTDKQDLNNQKLEILEYARQNNLTVDEFVEITSSSRKTSKQRRIDELAGKLADSDTLWGINTQSEANPDTTFLEDLCVAKFTFFYESSLL